MFARWAFPAANFEVYGEFARNDASLNLREIIVEPDHATAYMFGAQKLFPRSASRWEVLRGEIVNSRASHIDRVRPQVRFYEHNPFRQGHTSRGEVLGSVAVMGGSGFVLGADRYTPDGVTTFELHRIGRNGPAQEGYASTSQLDMQYVLRGERTQFRAGSDLVLGAGLVLEPNRNFGKTDFGVTLSAGYRWGRRPPPPPTATPASSPPR